MGKEVEIKLEVGDLQLLDCILSDPEITGRMSAPFDHIRMETTYFDTEDGFLAARRWMLRLRTENGRAVVTCKTPGEGRTRGEWECESEYLEDALPQLAALGAPAELCGSDAARYMPLCGARFTRITQELRLSAEHACMICGDIGELFAGEKKAPLCELELELKHGAAEALEEYADLLKTRFGLCEQPRSKLERARALVQASV